MLKWSIVKCVCVHVRMRALWVKVTVEDLCVRALEEHCSRTSHCWLSVCLKRMYRLDVMVSDNTHGHEHVLTRTRNWSCVHVELWWSVNINHIVARMITARTQRTLSWRSLKNMKNTDTKGENLEPVLLCFWSIALRSLRERCVRGS